MNARQLNHWLESSNQSRCSTLVRKPLLMGIVNITPNSFSDGGAYLVADKALTHALRLAEQGADIIDLGGESTKPGVQDVSLDEELQRVIPVIERIRMYSDVCISIDTYKPLVMNAAVNAGANLINDVYALRQDGALAMAAQLDVPVCLMHMQGQPRTMQDRPEYKKGIMYALNDFFVERVHACTAGGIATNRLIIDPGFGFGKRMQDNMAMLRELRQLHDFALPILLGVSRKSSIGVLLNKPAHERVIGSVALAVHGVLNGAQIIRAHDVDETKQALQVIEAIYATGNT